MTKLYKSINFITIILLVLSGCSATEESIEIPDENIDIESPTTPNVIVIKEGSDTIGDKHEEASDEEKDVLPEDDQNKPVEDNINVSDLLEDEELTEIAEEENVTQDEIGTAPEEIDESMKEDMYRIIHEYNSVLPDGITKELLYTDYPIAYNYVLITSSSVNIRMQPDTASKVIQGVVYGEKYSLIESVKGLYIEKYDSDTWYKISLKNGGDEIKTGYVFAALTEARNYQFDKMLKEMNMLKGQLDNNTTGYINNYKNFNGTAPLYNGKTTDNYGHRRYQSAALYDKPDTKSPFRYGLDGMLCNVLEETNYFYKVKVITFEGEYYVEKKYISFENTITNLSQVLIVDRKYQNSALFEYRDNGWVMVSYVFVTTGKPGEYSLVTPLGHFMGIQKRNKFLYYGDGTKEIAGYAPYALRFSGGGYTHGVPVNYIIKDDGEKIDPGLKEYLHTIGTIPKSHMCVRNYTSHAKFLYDWFKVGSGAVIVIE